MPKLGRSPRELANQRRRFSYRQLNIMLRREGVMTICKKTQRFTVSRDWRSGDAGAESVLLEHGRCSDAGPAKPGLEFRIRARPDGVRTTIPRAERGRCRDPGVLCGGAGRINRWQTCHARPDGTDRTARQAEDDQPRSYAKNKQTRGTNPS